MQRGDRGTNRGQIKKERTKIKKNADPRTDRGHRAGRETEHPESKGRRTDVKETKKESRHQKNRWNRKSEKKKK